MILERAFDFVNVSVILSSILIFVGWITQTPYIFKILSFIVKIMVALFLIIKFSGAFKSLDHMSPLDRKICFVSGMYLIVFTLGDYIHTVAYKWRPWVLNIIPQIPQLKTGQ